MRLLHCGFSSHCYSCTSRACFKFCPRNMGSRHSTMFVFALFLLTSFPVYDMKSRFSSSLFFISTVFLVYVAAAVSVVLALVWAIEDLLGSRSIFFMTNLKLFKVSYFSNQHTNMLHSLFLRY